METRCWCTCPAGVPGLRHLWWRPSTDISAPTGFHQHPHADTYTIPNGHSYAHKHPGADGDADSYTAAEVHPYAHKHPGADGNSGTYTYTAADVHPYAHNHSLPDADALVHSHGCTYYDIRTRSHAYP